MTDIADSTPTADVADAPAPAAEPAAEPAAAVDPLDRDIPPGVDRFDRKYVTEIRGEAANYRTKAREAQAELDALRAKYEAFEQYDDADMKVWGELAGTWQANPTQAAEQMRMIAQNVLGDPTATPAEKAEAQQQIDAADQVQADPANIDDIVQQKMEAFQAEQQMKADVARIESQVEDAGWAKGTPDYATVLWHATNNPDAKGDIAKAIEAHKAYRQSIIDEYVSSVKNGRTPPRTASDGQPATATTEITNMREAGEAAQAFLRDRQRA